jgi:hypothetical protein
MEKRRRARINQSLNELKQLLLDGNSSKKEVYLISVTVMTHGFVNGRLIRNSITQFISKYTVLTETTVSL